MVHWKPKRRITLVVVWAHSTSGGKYGENLAQYGKSSATSFPLVPWLDQFNGWYEEYKYWTCSSNACSSVCGHLTQLASKSTMSVGCGVADCDAGTVSSFRSQYMVCQYYPPGNVNLATKHPVSGLAYPYNGCPGSNPPITNNQPSTPTAPVKPPSTPTAPVKPPSTPTTPVKPPSTPTAPVKPPSTPTTPGNTVSWTGCIGDYWPNNIQKLTPCQGQPKTIINNGVKDLYCPVGDPKGYLWPVYNKNTPECQFVAAVVDDSTASSSGELPMSAWIGIGVGITALIVVAVVIAILLKKRAQNDERV